MIGKKRKMKLQEFESYFKEFEKDTELVIQDADTGWILKVTKVFTKIEKETGKQVLVLRSGYANQIECE